MRLCWKSCYLRTYLAPGTVESQGYIDKPLRAAIGASRQLEGLVRLGSLAPILEPGGHDVPACEL